MEYDLFHTEKAILCFLSNFLQNMWVFPFLIKSVARECVTMVTNHTVPLYRKTRKALESRSDGLSINTKH